MLACNRDAGAGVQYHPAELWCALTERAGSGEKGKLLPGEMWELKCPSSWKQIPTTRVPQEGLLVDRDRSMWGRKDKEKWDQ